MATIKGRPTKYKEAYLKKTIDFLASGKSITQLARELQVNKSTIYEWANNNPTFSDALDTGREYSQAHWETELESMMYSKEVNAPLVKLYFANRFGWSDKQEVESKGDSSIEISFKDV